MLMANSIVSWPQEVLEHLTDDQRRQGLAEMARVLKPGGHVFVTVPADENLAEGRVVCPGLWQRVSSLGAPGLIQCRTPAIRDFAAFHC